MFLFPLKRLQGGPGGTDMSLVVCLICSFAKECDLSVCSVPFDKHVKLHLVFSTS